MGADGNKQTTVSLDSCEELGIELARPGGERPQGSGVFRVVNGEHAAGGPACLPDRIVFVGDSDRKPAAAKLQRDGQPNDSCSYDGYIYLLHTVIVETRLSQRAGQGYTLPQG
jgi:hypothetical protein